MSVCENIFVKLENYIVESKNILSRKSNLTNTNRNSTEIINDGTEFPWTFLRNLIADINILSDILNNDISILISVKNQKLLRSCFQIISSLGFSQSLLPGVGINLKKRNLTSEAQQSMILNDDQKYQLLVECTDFFITSYTVPILKNIIIAFHLSDYLAALMQLSFAPLKKPGIYSNYIMTQEHYDKLQIDRKKYTLVYENLVSNCFQPILMKELLVLQGVNDPPAPNFVKIIVAKEMSRRLLAPNGLLSLICCFMENYSIDTGFEWKKIDMICKIVSTKHGNESESDYLVNISQQINTILVLNNVHYLMTAVACVYSLNEKYPQSAPVNDLLNKLFQNFKYGYLKMKSLPGTIIMTTQEIENNINILHVALCVTKLNWPIDLWSSNIPILFIIGMVCNKSSELKQKVNSIIIKFLEDLPECNLLVQLNKLLFSLEEYNSISVQEFEAGLLIKSSLEKTEYNYYNALLYLLEIVNSSVNTGLIRNIFKSSLQMLINVTAVRSNRSNQELLTLEEELNMDDVDQQYAVILQLLSELCNTPKITTLLKDDPSVVVEFIEHFLLRNAKSDEECTTIALVLLNTLLSNYTTVKHLKEKYVDLITVLKKFEDDTSSHNSILCKEALSMILSNNSAKVNNNTPYSKAIDNVFNSLLPVSAHGLIELTKLINAKDPETISKKHYIFCLFQEKLKDEDSYIYLSAINGLALLATHCTEDVLHVICNEFLKIANENDPLETKELQQRTVEIRLKIGDILVKVTKGLGEMAIVHKTILLNTMLCACRDPEPLIRASALSNIAEIALVLNYKIGAIIYEVLLCVWSILESDKVIECRRAAVMVISSLLKGLGKNTLIELKENLLPVYRTLKYLYHDPNEDSILRLHAQIALEELNDIVTTFLFPELTVEKSFYIPDEPVDIVFK